MTHINIMKTMKSGLKHLRSLRNLSENKNDSFMKTKVKPRSPCKCFLELPLTQFAVFFRETNILVKSSVNFINSNVFVFQITTYHAKQHEEQLI